MKIWDSVYILANGQWRSSILDHVYVKGSMIISNLEPNKTLISDHKLITMIIGEKRPAIPSSFLGLIVFIRSFHHYTSNFIDKTSNFIETMNNRQVNHLRIGPKPQP